MKILKKERKMCISCMEEHEVLLVGVVEENIFKGQRVEYEAIYEYCENTDEYVATTQLISLNDISMKNAYRKSKGLLSTDEIIKIREKYDISQMDLALLLGWGGKTITRYEGHHVQDMAHDSILRKLDQDPEWFVNLLEQEKSNISITVYKRYRDRAMKLFEKYQDNYLRKSIEAQYAQLNGSEDACGNENLNIDKVIDVVSFLANSEKVTNLYKVKLMKLLWYIDALSYKRRGKSLTGLAYRALPMGAVPIAHKTIMELHGIKYEEVDFDEGVGYHFVRNPEATHIHLSVEEVSIINDVIKVCGLDSKEQIVNRMHGEQAYQKTIPGEIIKYQYSRDLSLV